MSWSEWITSITTWGSGTDFMKYSLFTTIFTILLLLLATKLINQLCIKLIKKHYHRPNIKSLLRTKTILLYTISGYAILDLFTPFQTILKTLLAGGGVLAVVIGLAAQEAAGNFVNGMMISIFKPFKIGDLIKVNNGQLTGTVIDITIRHTVIKTFENTKIVVPNNVMNDAILENVTAVGDKKANFLELEIGYESDLEQAMRIIEEEVTKHPNYLDARTDAEKEEHQAAVVTRLIEFGESGLRLKTTVYSRNNAEGFAMLSDLRIAIKRRFDDAGIDIPYPHRTILMKEQQDHSSQS